MITIIKRGAWSKYTKRTFNPFNKRKVDCIAIHHTASAYRGASRGAQVAYLQAVERYHVVNNGWKGIAYNFIVFPDGTVYEGRGVGSQSAANGNGALNSKHVAICVAGNFDVDTTSPLLITTLKQLVALVEKTYKISNVVGHRDLKSTSCPGRNLYSVVKLLNADECCEEAEIPQQTTTLTETLGSLIGAVKMPSVPGVASHTRWRLTNGKLVTVWLP